MQSIVILLLGSLVLGVTIIFFLDSQTEPTDQISSIQEHLSACQEAAGEYPRCNCDPNNIKYCENDFIQEFPKLHNFCITSDLYEKCKDENENNEEKITKECFKQCCSFSC